MQRICPKGHYYDDSRYSRCPTCGVTLPPSGPPPFGMEPGEDAMGTRCPEGHWYDGSKYSQCPHCVVLRWEPEENEWSSPVPSLPPPLPRQTPLHGGRYVVGREVLGRGGFGITYLAWDSELKEPVAIKEFLPVGYCERGQNGVSVRSTPEYGEEFRLSVQKFLEGARIAAGIEHFNLARAREAFEENGTGYMVMDCYRGMTLAEYLEQFPSGEGMPETMALAVMRPIMDVLREVHGKGVLHGDVKPSNILLVGRGRPVLMDLDFAAARQVIHAVISRTPGYAPIEQSDQKAGRQGPWTDVYACAATLYRMVSGQNPPLIHRGIAPNTTGAAVRTWRDQLHPLAELVPGVSAGFSEAVQRGLAFEPQDRPQSVDDFLRLLGVEPDGDFESVWPIPNDPASAKTRCPQGHYYDDSKYIQCPYCLIPDQSAEHESPPPFLRFARHLPQQAPLLGGKYVVEDFSQADSSIKIYRAWDNEQNEEVILAEFFPTDMAERGEDRTA